MKITKHVLDLGIIITAFITSAIMKLKKENRDVWLISERRDEAEDNGYHLYKYIRENHPEHKVFYVIDKNSPSYLKIEKYKTIVQHNSLRHYIYYFLAEKHLSAFQFFGVPETPILWRLESLGIIKKKKIFLQHGITKERLPFLQYQNTKYNLFVCGAKPEFDYVKEQFGYPEKSVKYLGFCRFDNLHEYKLTNKILLMPTWRQWFGMTNKENDLEKESRLFWESEYYKRYNSLLHNKELLDLLNENNYELIFYPHPEMQRYIKAFNSSSTNIKIADRKNFNLQHLLKECNLLITDYSSIAFDFAYMKKPLIYYQFDKEKYYKSHFQKGYFDCDSDGFGPVISNEKVLVKKIEDYIVNNFIEEVYFEKIDTFFELRDKENCRRNYEAVCEI